MIHKHARSQINVQQLQWNLIDSFLEREDKDTLESYLHQQHFNKNIFFWLGNWFVFLKISIVLSIPN